TGAIYDILADIFTFERKPAIRDDSKTLYDVAQYLLSLILRAIKAAPASAGMFADVANQMLSIANADGKPVQYRNFIRNRFTVREVVVSATPLTADMAPCAPCAPRGTSPPRPPRLGRIWPRMRGLHRASWTRRARCRIVGAAVAPCNIQSIAETTDCRQRSTPSRSLCRQL